MRNACEDLAPIGYLKSPSFGHTVGAGLGMACLSYPNGVTSAWPASACRPRSLVSVA